MKNKNVKDVEAIGPWKKVAYDVGDMVMHFYLKSEYLDRLYSEAEYRGWDFSGFELMQMSEFVINPITNEFVKNGVTLGTLVELFLKERLK